MSIDSAIELARELLADKDSIVERCMVKAGRGRPAKGFRITLDKRSVELPAGAYQALMDETRKEIEQAQKANPLVPLSDDEFEVLNKYGAPNLFYRVYKLAMASGELKDVVQASRLLAEYGYGKPTQKVEITEKAEFVRRGWADVPEMPVVDVEPE